MVFSAANQVQINPLLSIRVAAITNCPLPQTFSVTIDVGNEKKSSENNMCFFGRNTLLKEVSER